MNKDKNCLLLIQKDLIEYTEDFNQLYDYYKKCWASEIERRDYYKGKLDGLALAKNSLQDLERTINNYKA